MSQIRIGILGVGKIAKEQHIPAIRRNPEFALVACASRHARLDDCASYADLASMLDGCPELDAVSVCTPPQVHFEAARLALLRGKHVFLEKPPCRATMQLDELVRLAHQGKRTLFQTWHARHAAAVDATRSSLAGSRVRRGRILWKEDVRQWHPGQSWLWEAGGFGVFDPGINAVSILTHIVPEAVFVRSADLYCPANCDSPIAAQVTFETNAGAIIEAEFDFLYTAAPQWDIELDTDQGPVALTAHGSKLRVGDRQVAAGTPETEYPSLYRRFAELIGQGASDADGAPFRLVADIFLIGKRHTVAPFNE